jgi:hypothetical protein
MAKGVKTAGGGGSSPAGLPHRGGPSSWAHELGLSHGDGALKCKSPEGEPCRLGPEALIPLEKAFAERHTLTLEVEFELRRITGNVTPETSRGET